MNISPSIFKSHTRMMQVVRWETVDHEAGTRQANPAEIRRAIRTGRPVPFHKVTKQIDITEATK